MNAPWLKEGVTTVTRGHAKLSGGGAGRTSLCVHGQRAFSGDGGGKSTSLLRSIGEIVRIIGRCGNRAKDRRTPAAGHGSLGYLTIESLSTDARRSHGRGLWLTSSRVRRSFGSCGRRPRWRGKAPSAFG